MRSRLERGFTFSAAAWAAMRARTVVRTAACSEEWQKEGMLEKAATVDMAGSRIPAWRRARRKRPPAIRRVRSKLRTSARAGATAADGRSEE
ncbi:MAG: hypothetical protein A2W21_02035 [Betaproteobacteria bacterium RBG_16_66_20]|nr:MAG: hypothetical protein A2W21_02035 [Betaproteobacteria bacterium RBG_16_66_20]